MKRLCVLISAASLVCGGCDLLYGILQKEGAQEKALLGEVIPYERNEQVALLQRLLAIHGFPSGPIDGKFGAKVREAVVKFQEAEDLPASRFVDNTTWEALNVFSTTGLVADGQVNLKTVQELLAAQGLDPGTPDGKMGPKTKKAIEQFQKKNGLKVDGKIGGKTLRAMHACLSGEEKGE